MVEHHETDNLLWYLWCQIHVYVPLKKVGLTENVLNFRVTTHSDDPLIAFNGRTELKMVDFLE